MKTVLITGAGTGIGLSTLKLAHNAGYKIIAAIHYEKEAAGLPKNVEWIAGDLTKPAIREEIIKKFAHKTDIIILNAGHGESGPLIEQPEDRIRKVFEINVFSTILLAQGFGKVMAKRRHGRLIFVSSMAGFVTVSTLGAYCATKHALEALADAMRMELKPFNVEVASLEPGLIYTGFNEGMAASKFDWLTKNSLFAASLENWKKRDETLPSRSYSVDVAAKDLFSIVKAKHPRAHNPTPRIYTYIKYVFPFLPVKLQDKILSA